MVFVLAVMSRFHLTFQYMIAFQLAFMNQYPLNCLSWFSQAPILRLEKVRNQDLIKYNLVNSEQIEYQGVVHLNEKINHFSIDQYQRMQQDLEKEIDQLQEKKDIQSNEAQQQIESEIKLKQTILNIIADEHNRKSDEPSTYLKSEQPFRILKVGQDDGSEYKSVQNTKIYFFEKNKLYIGLASHYFLKRFQVFDLFVQRSDQTITPFNSNDEEFQNFKSLLIYDTIILVVTKYKVYTLQIIKSFENESDKNQLVLEEIFTLSDQQIAEERVPQICFIKDNLYLLDYQEKTQGLLFKCIKDLMIYPEFQVVPQPQVYLEVSESSRNEKVLLMTDDFSGDIILLTPDQYFIYDLENNRWQEKDLQLQTNQGISDKLNFKFYDYHQDEEYNSKGKKVQQFSNLVDDQVEEQKNVYFIDSDDSNKDEGEQDTEDILDSIFENSHQIKVINSKERKFFLLNINNDQIYKLDLRDSENNQVNQINKVECLINLNICSSNIVYKDKSFFYIIQIEQIDFAEQDHSNVFLENQDLEQQFEEQLKLLEKEIPGLNSKEQLSSSPFFKNTITCSNLAIFQAQKYA